MTDSLISPILDDTPPLVQMSTPEMLSMTSLAGDYPAMPEPWMGYLPELDAVNPIPKRQRAPSFSEHDIKRSRSVDPAPSSEWNMDGWHQQLQDMFQGFEKPESYREGTDMTEAILELEAVLTHSPDLHNATLQQRPSSCMPTLLSQHDPMAFPQPTSFHRSMSPVKHPFFHHPNELPSRPSSTPVSGLHDFSRTPSPFIPSHCKLSDDLLILARLVEHGLLERPSSAASTASTLSENTGSSLGKRSYKCPKPYCSKSYKNSNGLKYHLEHGNCELETSPEHRHALKRCNSPAVEKEGSSHSHLAAAAAAAAGGSLQSMNPTAFDEEIQDLETVANETDVKVIARPYQCRVPGCGKKYKNLNGLKYHHRTVHPKLDFLRHVRGQSTPHPKSSFATGTFEHTIPTQHVTEQHQPYYFMPNGMVETHVPTAVYF